MSYEQFVQEIETKLKQKVGDSLKIYIHTAVKNNGYTKKGVTFAEDGINVSPTIYLEEYYERFVRGEHVEVIIEQIVQLYQNVRVHHSMECDFIYDYEKIKDRIVMRLINKEANQKILKDAPYICFYDLAIVFHVLVELDEQRDRMATMLIKKEYLEWWNLSVEKMYELAMFNTEKLLPAEMSTMFMVIEKIFPEWDHLNMDSDDDFMYILTNNRKSFGACAMLYPHRLEMIGEYLKESFYILPSSVHEVIILPESKAVSKNELNQIIHEINCTQVPEEEVLSDNAYFYDIFLKRIVM